MVKESFYAKYLRERTDDEILETDFGFASYRVINDGKSIYIIDIYIDKDHRKSGEASHMADMIAGIGRGRGCVELLGTVKPSAKNSTDSLRVLLGYGMRLDSSAQDVILFKKEL